MLGLTVLELTGDVEPEVGHAHHGYPALQHPCGAAASPPLPLPSCIGLHADCWSTDCMCALTSTRKQTPTAKRVGPSGLPPEPWPDLREPWIRWRTAPRPAPQAGQLDGADLICTTPEKFDALSRKLGEKGGLRFFSDVRVGAGVGVCGREYLHVLYVSDTFACMCACLWLW